MKQKSLRNLFVAFAAVGFAGCGGKVRPDPSLLSAIEANYPTAEMICDGMRFNGLGICRYQEGQTSMKVQVQGYYKGTVRIDSERCQIAQSYSYENNGIVEITIKPAESCLIDVVVSPTYSKAGGEASLKGRLYIKKLLFGQDYYALSNKVAKGTDEIFRVPAIETSRVVFRGCGAMFDKVVMPDAGGEIKVRLSDLTPNRDDCLFEGVVVGGTSGDIKRTSWQVWTYDQRFTPLALPVVKFGSGLEVIADPAVAIISLDEEYVLGNKAKFKLPLGTHVLRLMTVKGRTVIGEWDGRDFEWMN